MTKYAVLEKADAMILVTEWKPFRIPDLDAMRRLMQQAIIFDGRNPYEPQQIKAAGFEYQGVGRS